MIAKRLAWAVPWGAGLLVTLIASAAMAETTAGAIARGDSHWQGRAEGQVGGRPRPEPIGQAVAAYEEALALDPRNLEARWKLMRALVFRGEHVETDTDRRIETFDRGRALGEAGMHQIAAPIGGLARVLEMSGTELRSQIEDSTEAAEVFFWSAAHTGLWGRTRGKMASAREGVASKVRDYASASTRLDGEIENGGGHRILGRLHTEAPKIPFITGWIDRKTAVSQLEVCHRYAPEDLTTKLYLGEALIEFVAQRRDEGIQLLRSVVESTPDPGWLIEELKAQADARTLLDRL